MKICHKDAILLISRIVHSNKNDIKKLSQADRKICMAAVECLSSKEDKRINVNLPGQLSFDKAIMHIKKTLDSKMSSKNILIHIAISAVKGVLNFLRLRISSAQLCKSIDLVKKSFLTNNWDQYLKDYCDFTANCKLDKAKIIFIGDQHADYYQNILRQNLITHYGNEDQIGENLVLLEGLDINDFPKNLDNKKFTVESWESEEHFEEQGKLLEENCKLLKEMNIELKKLEKLKNNKDVHLKYKKKEIVELLAKIKKINADFDGTKKECDKLKKIRDEDLIDKVKVNTLNQERKIFVIAGENHLLENGYSVIDSFNDFPCAVIIPKVSNLGEQNADKVVQNIIKLGAYDAAYINL